MYDRSLVATPTIRRGHNKTDDRRADSNIEVMHGYALQKWRLNHQTIMSTTNTYLMTTFSLTEINNKLYTTWRPRSLASKFKAEGMRSVSMLVRYHPQFCRKIYAQDCAAALSHSAACEKICRRSVDTLQYILGLRTTWRKHYTVYSKSRTRESA